MDARLLVWLSPAFPVGAFAYSHGLELAAERGWITGRAGLEGWLGDLVTRGSLRNDLILLAAAWRATGAADFGALAEANVLALALQPSAERHLETTTQGRAFLEVIAAAWCGPQVSVDGPAAGPDAPLTLTLSPEGRGDACTAMPPATSAIAPGGKTGPTGTIDVGTVVAVLAGEVAQPVAVGAVTAVHGMVLIPTLDAFAISFAGNLVSAAIRLSVVGQTDGQRVLAALMPALTTAARAAAAASLDDIGSATLASDLVSLAHETQYSRLFRS